MSDWPTDEKGLIIQVITGHTTGLLAEAGPILKIEYVSRQDPIGGPTRSILFGMTAKQALELADDLRDLANQAPKAPPGTRLS